MTQEGAVKAQPDARSAWEGLAVWTWICAAEKAEEGFRAVAASRQGPLDAPLRARLLTAAQGVRDGRVLLEARLAEIESGTGAWGKRPAATGG